MNAHDTAMDEEMHDFTALLLRYFAEDCSDSEVEEIEEMLTRSEEHRLCYVHVVKQMGEITKCLRAEESFQTPVLPTDDSPTSIILFSRTSVLFAIAALVLLSLTFFLLQPDPIATISRVHGTASLIHDQSSSTLSFESVLHNGDSLNIASQSSVELFHADRTRIVINGPAMVTWKNSDTQQGIILKYGLLEADVLPQLHERPLIITTSHMQTKVLGTRFTILAEQNESLLIMQEGTVECTTEYGQQTVRANETIRADHKTLHALGHISAEQTQLFRGNTIFLEEFSHESPFVDLHTSTNAVLPYGATGASLLHQPLHERHNLDYENHRVINLLDTATNKPLFPIRSDMVLHLTFKHQKHAFINLRLSTNKHNSWRYTYKTRQSTTWQPDTWQTVSIPLEHFTDFSNDPDYLTPTEPETQCMRLTLHTYHNTDFIIERMWVTENY